MIKLFFSVGKRRLLLVDGLDGRLQRIQRDSLHLQLVKGKRLVHTVAEASLFSEVVC